MMSCIGSKLRLPGPAPKTTMVPSVSNPGNATVIDSNDEPVARMISAPPSHARSSNAINQTANGRLPAGPAVSGLFR